MPDPVDLKAIIIPQIDRLLEQFNGFHDRGEMPVGSGGDGAGQPTS